MSAKAQPDGSLVTSPVTEPGAYSVLKAKNRVVPAPPFSATLDPAESDLGRVPQDTLTEYFGEDTVKASTGDADKPVVPLWTWLILAACLTFFFEDTLLRK